MKTTTITITKNDVVIIVNIINEAPTIEVRLPVRRTTVEPLIKGLSLLCGLHRDYLLFVTSEQKYSLKAQLTIMFRHQLEKYKKGISTWYFTFRYDKEAKWLSLRFNVRKGDERTFGVIMDTLSRALRMKLPKSFKEVEWFKMDQWLKENDVRRIKRLEAIAEDEETAVEMAKSFLEFGPE